MKALIAASGIVGASGTAEFWNMDGSSRRAAPLIAAASEPMLGVQPCGQRPATDGERPPSAPPWCHSWPV